MASMLLIHVPLTTLNLSRNIHITLIKLWWYVDERSKSRHKKPINTENWIDVKGARALSEALKINTTLQSLNLVCEQQESEKMDELQTLPTINTNKQATRSEQKEQEH